MKNIFVISDIHGCLDTLKRLINKLPSQSKILCIGDLINRGPDSLNTLRFLKELQEFGKAECILGNHDIYLLTKYADFNKNSLNLSNHLLDVILNAQDCLELMEWLRYRPLVMYIFNTLLVHAGVLPLWTTAVVLERAKEVEFVLRSKQYKSYLIEMYRFKTNIWSETLKGSERLQVIISAITRIRFCTTDGIMNFEMKGNDLNVVPKGYMPWFLCPNRKTYNTSIIFGHWSTLGFLRKKNLIGIDTGCVWNGKLTAIALDGSTLYQENRSAY